MEATFSQKLLAHELTLARPAHDTQKLARSLNSAQVDLNPHQIDAALFAFRSPLSRGAILADEVGLGKTIEAGLVIGQLYAEGKKKMLLFLPASIRKQWQNELWEKFALQSFILDGAAYRDLKKEGHTNPFRAPTIVITSTQFAYSKRDEVKTAGPWDLVIFDEAHRLRNVYKKGNKVVKSLREMAAGQPKLLLTDLHIPLLSDLGLAATIAVPVYEVSVKLTEIAEIIQGCKPFQVGKGDPLQTREIVETQPFVADYRKDKIFRPFLRGSLIDRYTILWDGDYWISFGDWLAEPRYSANFDATEKIFVRQTGDSLVATLDTSQFIGRDNLYVIHSKTSEISLLWLLAILNSRLLNQIYHLLNPEVGEALAQVKREHLAILPIHRINFTTPEKERARLLEEGKKLYERCLAKGDQVCVLEFAAHALKETPEQADVVHDLLAFLAGQMIEMSKTEQAEGKGFLGWLEREIGAKVDDLKNKTKLEDYYEGTFEGFLEVLKKNRKSFTIDPSRREFQDRLGKEYVDSLAKLGPLKARIEATDRLIDQIVYRLYGLTEEEITTVEAGGKQ